MSIWPYKEGVGMKYISAERNGSFGRHGGDFHILWDVQGRGGGGGRVKCVFVPHNNYFISNNRIRNGSRIAEKALLEFFFGLSYNEPKKEQID